MARAPFQVLVFPYRRTEAGHQFAVFRRSDLHYWQGVAGGGTIGEGPVEAARREAHEEAGIPAEAPFFQLTFMTYVPVSGFAARSTWPKDLYVIPEFAFGVDATDCDLVLSREHSEVRWVSAEEARQLLHWQSNAVAIWELASRIEDGNLRPA